MLYIITGVSRGLGKAVAEQLLNSGFEVIGVGRSHTIDHQNFSFVECDLSNTEKVKSLFSEETFETPVTLINNAGIIGTIKRLSDQDEPDTEKVMDVNVLAPVLLTNTIYNGMQDKNSFTLVNISSGAANRAIPSWASYCASKAALNMLSETFYLEEREKGIDLKVYAVAPGVIDTGMQEQIRNSGKGNFSSVDNFIAMKEEGVLFSADESAKRLIALLDQNYAGEVFYDLRNVNP